MTVLWLIILSAAVLAVAGRIYSNFIARSIGEDNSRPTPAVVHADGQDYVPTPTGVVFAHHYASIAGAGPILGPVVAIIFGWVPAILWIVFGGVFIGAVHDYLATFIATREGGRSIATVARRMLGRDAFIALTIFLVVILALVCATFLNASAKALTSKLPLERLSLPADQTLLRVVEEEDKNSATTKDGIAAKDSAAAKGVATTKKAVIGGIASMSVICITAVAPLIGWMYIRRKVAVWKCSVLAVVICGASITVGVFYPISLTPTVWKLMLSAYVLVAAGIPVWVFLQSRDFINVHILYIGIIALMVVLIVAGIAGPSAEVAADPIPAWNVAQGEQIKGPFWPMLFILIACGSVSGFHSLCASGTTCKQLTSERAARHIGYYGMLLESFLAVCVVAVLIAGVSKANYLADVHPVVGKGNWVLGFAMAVGGATKAAFGGELSLAIGALGGMVLLEGFLVTTLDTAIRLMRYLIEEIWRTIFGHYDVFAEPVAQGESARDEQELTHVGAGGLPHAPPDADEPAPPQPTPTSGARRMVLGLLRHYWVNSAIAVGLMLAFAFTGGVDVLWDIFATSNQLLAGMVLSLSALWLMKKGKRFWFALVPGVLMLVTTIYNYIRMIPIYAYGKEPKPVLMVANVVLLIIAAYLIYTGIRTAVKLVQNKADSEKA